MIRASLSALASFVLLGVTSLALHSPVPAPPPLPCQPGSPVTCRVNDPHGLVKTCPPPAGPQTPLCAYVGGAPTDPDTHITVHLDPALCLHLALDPTTSRDLLRSLGCPPTTQVGPAPALPAAPAPSPITASLPVTH